MQNDMRINFTLLVNAFASNESPESRHIAPMLLAIDVIHIYYNEHHSIEYAAHEFPIYSNYSDYFRYRQYARLEWILSEVFFICFLSRQILIVSRWNQELVHQGQVIIINMHVDMRHIWNMRNFVCVSSKLFFELLDFFAHSHFLFSESARMNINTHKNHIIYKPFHQKYYLIGNK